MGDVNEYRPRIVAHRGAWWDEFPENSFEAFLLAEKRGLLCECDVWATTDGKPIVMHDETLNRTTTGSGLVSSVSSKDLSHLYTRFSNDTFFVQMLFHPPPLLEQVAELVHYVEIKPTNDRDLVRKVIEIMRGTNWLLQSFYPANLEHALAEDATTKVAFLADDEESINLAIVNRWDVHANYELLNEQWMTRLRDRGVRVGAWTVNEIKDLRRMFELKVDTIITDRTKRAKRIVTLAGLTMNDEPI